ncbi:hypothetical protein ASU31_00730 [Pedobacter ginsenosidimutans]|uniref:Uncharacterized protein n=2 Tax=Pedobacter ginsenosidimutans TaxID=687842 RepID=A0A0T5VVF9_9SPHI|nr:hypothetical protein ASU31_00730 [Pedobacter ginsenosidimutans]
MPASRQLAKQFSGKRVSFVYLSIDEKFDSCEKASKEEDLDSNTYSFLLLNPKESGILKLIQFKTIPRYLLFDKNGKSVHENAPDRQVPN